MPTISDLSENTRSGPYIRSKEDDGGPMTEHPTVPWRLPIHGD